MTREEFDQFENNLRKKSILKKLITLFIILALIGGCIGIYVYLKTKTNTIETNYYKDYQSPFSNPLFIFFNIITGICIIFSIFVFFENICTIYRNNHYYTIYNKFALNFCLYIDGKEMEYNYVGSVEREYVTPEGTLLTLTIGRGSCTLFFAGDTKPIFINLVLSDRFIEISRN